MKAKIQFTAIDLQNWNRGEMFYYFSKMAPTGYSITTKLDVTKMRQTLKEANYKFFPAYLWLVTKLLNEQMEFKIAKVDEQLGYYNVLTPMYATFHEDDKTFSFMWTEFDDSFEAFHEAYLEDHLRHGTRHGVLAKENQLPPPNAYTISCIPWVDFDHFAVHTYENKAYFFPSVEAGKLCERNGRVYMPLSLTCHHATTDGYHIGLFLDKLQTEADHFAQYL